MQAILIVQNLKMLNTKMTHAPLFKILHAFLSPADFFCKLSFKNPFRNTLRISNSLDPYQTRHCLIGPKLLAKVMSRQQNLQKSRLVGKE